MSDPQRGTTSNLQRSHHHDYREPCIYMLTVTVEGRRPVLGHLAGDIDTAHVELTPLGEDVRHELYALCDRYPQLKLLQYQIMPDHVHVIIQATERLPKPIGSLFSSWKIACGHAYGRQDAGTTAGATTAGGTTAGASALARDEADAKKEAYTKTTTERTQATTERTRATTERTRATTERTQATTERTQTTTAENTQTAAVDSQTATRITEDTLAATAIGALSGVAALAPQKGSPFRRLFSEGYNDRILQGPDQLRRMIDYVRDNPRRLLLKRANSPYFTIHRGINVAGHSFDAIGNLALLHHAPLLAVHCRRHWTAAEQTAYADRCIETATQGTTLIGAFISKTEQSVMHTLNDRHLPLIHLTENGIPDMYKPVGQAFYACSEGRLLLLAPWKYHPGRKVISREQCNALNTMAETIASLASQQRP